MAKVVVITDSEDFYKSIYRYFKYTHGIETKHIPYFGKINTCIEIYKRIAQELQKEIESEKSNLLVIVDFVDRESPATSLDGLSPLSPHGNIAPAVAMLIFTYPELHFVFFTPYKIADGSTKDKEMFEKFHVLKLCNISEIARLNFEENYSPIFDPTGFRNKMRENIKNLKKRDEVALVVDEEEAYAYMNGYISYKLGYRTYLVTTAGLLNRLQNLTLQNLTLTFEDMFLNFPDRGNAGIEHFSNLEERDERYNNIFPKAKKRIFITVGHRYYPFREENRRYIENLIRRERKVVKFVLKPTAGVFNLLQNAGLLKEYWKRRREEYKKMKPTHSNGVQNLEGTSHSSPGRLLVIAENLIKRAERILHEGKTVLECIVGATLVLEAQELLGSRTPTTYLEAVALRHQLEVKAECMFYGVAYNIDVKNRIEEIKIDVKSAANWFHPTMKKMSFINAQMGIITEIARIFRDFGQFDEEQKCMGYLRSLNRRWFFMNNPWLIPFWPLRWYVEKLLDSFGAFILLIFIWPFLLGVFSFIFKAKFSEEITTLSDYIMYAYFTFFGAQPVFSPINIVAKIFSFIAVLSGLLHLGIFIAYLYTLITRR